MAPSVTFTSEERPSLSSVRQMVWSKKMNVAIPKAPKLTGDLAGKPDSVHRSQHSQAD